MSEDKKQDRYHGYIPKCLNPFNPKHYFLLTYWYLFANEALDYYPNDPDYLFELLSKKFWSSKNQRNLFFMKSILLTFYGLLFLIIIAIVIAIVIVLWYPNKVHLTPVTAISISSNAEKVFSVSLDGNQKIWNLDQKKVKNLININSNISSTDLATSELFESDHIFNNEDLTLLIDYFSNNHQADIPISATLNSDEETAIVKFLNQKANIWDLQTNTYKSLNISKLYQDNSMLKNQIFSYLYNKANEDFLIFLENEFNLHNLSNLTNRKINNIESVIDIIFNINNNYEKIITEQIIKEKQSIILEPRFKNFQEFKHFITSVYNEYIARVSQFEPFINQLINQQYQLINNFQSKDFKNQKITLFSLDYICLLNILPCENDYGLRRKISMLYLIEVYPEQDKIVTVTYRLFDKSNIIIANLSTGKVIKQFDIPTILSSIDVTPNNRYVALGLKNNILEKGEATKINEKNYGSILVWDLPQNKPLENNLLQLPFHSGWYLAFFIIGVIIIFIYQKILYILLYILLYIPLLILAFVSQKCKFLKNPYEWNGYKLILPGRQDILLKKLKTNQKYGLILVVDIFKQNFFQRKVIKKTLKIFYKDYQLNHKKLILIYHVLSHNKLGSYRYELLNIFFDIRILSSKTLSDFINIFKTIEDLISKNKYTLVQDKNIINLSEYQETFNQLRQYPSGDEIADTFEIMDTFLSYQDLLELSDVPNLISKLPSPETSLRPPVITTLQKLGEIADKILAYQDSSSQSQKLRLLWEMNEALTQLQQYIETEVITPEKVILQKIVNQWKPLIQEAGGQEVSIEDLKPITNPYICGNPVTGSLFVGREDILQQLESIWGNPEQSMSVVIYGHRRMGKTSILQNLGQRFGKNTIIIDFDMQRFGDVENNNQLLLNLAKKIYFAWKNSGNNNLEKPQKLDFIDDPYMAFDSFLNNLEQIKGNYRFIITVDEFENIENGINENRLTPYLLGYFKSTFQYKKWLIMAFAGLHTLEEMCANYWNPLFGSVTPILVSFLSPKAAEKLITQSNPDFEINYNWNAVNTIIDLTNGQPYLIQLICYDLVNRFNQQMFENGRRPEQFTVEDVEAVISSPNFYLNGRLYFTGVWQQAETTQPDGQLLILKALSNDSMSIVQLAQITQLTPQQIQEALATLQRHDVIKEKSGCYSYTVELMRRWVQQKNQNN